MTVRVVGPRVLSGRVRAALAPGSSGCVVMAPGRPVADCRAEIEQLCRDSDPIPVVVVLAQIAPADMRRLVAAGARGAVLEDDLENALATTVAAVRAGQLAMPAAAFAGFGRPALSFREKQVLGLVVLGLANAEIATQLWLTESTVKSHLSNAFAKLGVRSRNEARTRILDPEEGLGTGILEISPAEERISLRSRGRG